jgi:hypothetical protein
VWVSHGGEQDVASCSLLRNYECSGGICCQHLPNSRISHIGKKIQGREAKVSGSCKLVGTV